jgi:hypothetical protein
MHSMDLTQISKSPVYHPPRHLQAKKGRTDRRPAPSLTASSWLKPGYHYLPELFLVYEVATSGCASGKSTERAQEGQNLGFDPVQRAGLALGAFRHVFAGGEGFPQVSEEGCLLLYVLVAEEGCNGKRGFFAVVEGDAPEWSA